MRQITINTLVHHRNAPWARGVVIGERAMSVRVTRFCPPETIPCWIVQDAHSRYFTLAKSKAVGEWAHP